MFLLTNLCKMNYCKNFFKKYTIRRKGVLTSYSTLKLTLIFYAKKIAFFSISCIFFAYWPLFILMGGVRPPKFPGLGSYPSRSCTSKEHNLFVWECCVHLKLATLFFWVILHIFCLFASLSFPGRLRLLKFLAQDYISLIREPRQSCSRSACISNSPCYFPYRKLMRTSNRNYSLNIHLQRIGHSCKNFKMTLFA